MGWLIFLGIILFIVLLLCLPVHVVAEWNNELRLKIRYLFLSFTVLPEQERKKKNKKEEHTEEKNEGNKPKEAKPKKKHSVEEVIDGITDGIQRYSPGAKIILHNIRVHYLEGFWRISAEDAAECAIKYGRICALLSSFFGVVRNALRIEKTKLKVFPDFIAEKDEIRILANFEANPIVIIFGALKIAVQYIKSISSKKKRYKKAPQTKRSIKKECA